MKRQTSTQSRHISTEAARFEIGLLKQYGFKVTDHGHKITAEKQ